MSTFRNIIADPATTHAAAGVAGAAVVLGALALHGSLRRRRGQARALELGLPLSPDFLGSLSDDEYALLKRVMRPALHGAGRPSE